jgi:hypothetical protein
MLRAAVALQKEKAQLSPQTFSDLRQALQHKAVQLLEPPRSEPNEESCALFMEPMTHGSSNQLSPTHYGIEGDVVSTRVHNVAALAADRVCKLCDAAWMSQLEVDC